MQAVNTLSFCQRIIFLGGVENGSKNMLKYKLKRFGTQHFLECSTHNIKLF